MKSVFRVSNSCVPLKAGIQDKTITRKDESRHPSGRTEGLTRIQLLLFFFLIFSVFPHIASADIYSNLIGHWKFNEMTGTTARDSSGNNRTGTLTNSPAWVQGKLEGALSFTPASDTYVAVPDSDDSKYTGPITLAAWVYVINNGSTASFISKNASNGASFNPFDFSAQDSNNNALRLVRASGDYYCEHYMNGTITLNGGWHHVVVVSTDGYIDTAPVFYIDGVNGGSITTGGGGCGHYLAAGSGHDIYIGRRDDGGPEMNGYMDDVRIYNRALSAADIAQLYNFRSPTMRRPQNNLGLIGYWPMNEGTSTVAGDFSGNGNNGTLTNNPTWTSGKLGKGLSFDGSNDYINAGDSSLLRLTSGDFTVSAWTYVTTNAQQMFLYHGLGGSSWTSWFLSIGGNENNPSPGKYGFGFGTANGPTGNNVYSVDSAATGRWVHLVGVYNGSNLYLYKDGVLDNSAAASGNPWNSTENFYIGADPAGGSERFVLNGKMDEVRIYNRALSAAEIKALYGSGTATVGGNEKLKVTDGLVGHWTFNGNDMNWTSQTTGTAYDRSGQGNNGTLTNMDQFLNPTSGKNGQGLNFDGANDYISFTSPNITNSSFSVSFWAMVEDQTDRAFFSIGNEQIANKLIHLTYYPTNGQVRFGFYSADTDVAYTLNSGQFYHLTFVYNDTTGQRSIYIDGQYIGGGPGGAFTGNLDGRIGEWYLSPTFWNYTKGKIDDVRIYNRALSVSEIKQLYNLGAGTVIKK